MTLQELLGITPDQWTQVRKTEVSAALREALGTMRTVRVDIPCTEAPAAAYWTTVLIGATGRAPSLSQEHADVIHTSGRIWDGTVLHVTWSGWPKEGQADFEDYQAFLAGRSLPSHVDGGGHGQTEVVKSGLDARDVHGVLIQPEP